MPPKPKFTKEQIVSAALDIVRDGSVEAITAQEMGKRLGTSTRPMFTYFDTVEELRQATIDAAWRLYDERVQQGLSFTPAFKARQRRTQTEPANATTANAAICHSRVTSAKLAIAATNAAPAKTKR
jgi:AcrR family transcriptional regulator